MAKIKCPICKRKLEISKTDWVLKERKTEGHVVATIGTAANAPRNIADAADAQIHSNLAAYDLDYDTTVNLGFRGTAYVQCPETRKTISWICVER